MTYRLMKRDPAWKALLICLGTLVGFFLVRLIWRSVFPASPAFWTADYERIQQIYEANAASWKTTGSYTVHEPEMKVIFHAVTTAFAWLGLYGLLCSIVVAAAPWVRATPFLMSLPIPRRQILAARLVSLTALAWVSFFTAYLVFEVMGSPPTTPLWTLLGFPAAVTLELVILQCFHMRERRCPLEFALGFGLTIPLSIWPLLAPAYWPQLAPVSPLAALVYPVGLLAAAAAILMSAWKTAPPTFDVPPRRAPDSVDSVDGVDDVADIKPSLEIPAPPLLNKAPRVPPAAPAGAFPAPAEETKTPSWRVAAKAVLRFAWIDLFFLGLLFFMSFMGMMRWYWTATYLPMILMWLSAPQGKTAWTQAPSARWLSTLPIRASSPLRMLLAGALVAVLGGYLLGTPIGMVLNLGLRVTPSQGWADPYRQPTPDCPTQNVMPPLEFWKPIESAPPVIRAPWGEEFQPPSSSVLGLNVYNPYAVGCHNTQRFFDWQIERATAAVYGTPIPFGPDGYMPESPTARMRVVTIAFLTAEILVIGIVFAFANGWRLARISRSLAQRLTMIISIVPAAAYLAFMLLSGRFTGVSDDPAVRILWALPDSLTAVIAITGGAVVLLYWIFDRLSREMEFAAGATSSVAEYWFRS